MARLARSQRFVPRSPGRLMQWDGASLEASRIFGSSSRTATGAFILPNGFILGEPVTLTRMIGTLTFMGRSFAAVTDQMVLSIGVIVVQENAFTAGVASLPDPAVEVEANWIYMRETVIGVGIDSMAGTYRENIDIRSQRKIKPTEVIAAVGNITTEAGTVTALVSLPCRFLFKLS